MDPVKNLVKRVEWPVLQVLMYLGLEKQISLYNMSKTTLVYYVTDTIFSEEKTGFS